MKKEINFDKNNARALAFAINQSLPFLVLLDVFTEDDEDYLFSLEEQLLVCNEFSICFDFEEK